LGGESLHNASSACHKGIRVGRILHGVDVNITILHLITGYKFDLTSITLLIRKGSYSYQQIKVAQERPKNTVTSSFSSIAFNGH